MAGIGSSGKTNALLYLLANFRGFCPNVEIYTYGLVDTVQEFANKELNAVEISSIDHLSSKKNSIIILDEAHLFGLSDKRKTEEINNFVAFINHSNNYCIVSTASLREFNSHLGGIVTKWLCKSIRQDQLINGSPLKRAVQNYRGRFKRLNDIILPLGKLLVLSDQREIIYDIPYLPQIDTKAALPDLFA